MDMANLAQRREVTFGSHLAAVQREARAEHRGRGNCRPLSCRQSGYARQGWSQWEQVRMAA